MHAVLLQGEQKERFNEIQQELSQLSTKFSNNVLDATKAFQKVLTTKEEVEGLPESGGWVGGWVGGRVLVRAGGWMG